MRKFRVKYADPYSTGFKWEDHSSITVDDLINQLLDQPHTAKFLDIQEIGEVDPDRIKKAKKISKLANYIKTGYGRRFTEYSQSGFVAFARQLINHLEEEDGNIS